MKKLLLPVLLSFPLLSYSQDTTYTSRGYNIEYQGLYLRVDTVHNITQAVSFFRGVHLFSIKLNNEYAHKNIKVKYGQPITIYDIHTEVFVERKNYKFNYTY